MCRTIKPRAEPKELEQDVRRAQSSNLIARRTRFFETLKAGGPVALQVQAGR
jgi:hypothetical protein